MPIKDAARRLEVNKAYDKAHTKQISLKLNIDTDQAILSRLDQVDNVQGYIKNLIADDIEKRRNTTMQKITLYIHYGVLAHEKQPVYSATAVSVDTVTVQIPEEYTISHNDMGEPLIMINGSEYLLNDVLVCCDDAPALKWYNGFRWRTVKLDPVT